MCVCGVVCFRRGFVQHLSTNVSGILGFVCGCRAAIDEFLYEVLVFVFLSQRASRDKETSETIAGDPARD